MMFSVESSPLYFFICYNEAVNFIGGDSLEPKIGKSRLPEWFVRTNTKPVDLAKHLKVSESYISKVSKGASRFSVVKMKAAADFFECHMDDLVEWIYE